MITAATSPGCDFEQPLHVSGVAGLGLQGLEQERPVGGVEEVDAADRHRADRVAVVGVAQRDEPRALGVLATRWCQYWKAIFTAISVAVEPLSE